jgi:hypothetical protein
MEARLSGFGFKIESITPEVQAISETSITEWKWIVEATKSGTHPLFLTMSALLYTEKSNRIHRTILTFERKIKVHVMWDKRVSGFVSGNWQWLWATILVPIGAWFVGKRRWWTSSSD